MANFPKSGLYRAWGQFQHEGRLLTADFTFEVQDELKLATTIFAIARESNRSGYLDY
jgi:hypothetical protein